MNPILYTALAFYFRFKGEEPRGHPFRKSEEHKLQTSIPQIF